MSMNWQADVTEFRRACGLPVGSSPRVIDAVAGALSISLIREEVEDELFEALRMESLPDAADAIVDSIYVLIGTAVEMGIDLAPLWDLVQDANMAKTGGPKRADGKQLKPEDWQPPRIAEEIRRQIDDA